MKFSIYLALVTDRHALCSSFDTFRESLCSGYYIAIRLTFVYSERYPMTSQLIEENKIPEFGLCHSIATRKTISPQSIQIIFMLTSMGLSTLVSLWPCCLIHHSNSEQVHIPMTTTLTFACPKSKSSLLYFPT